MFHVSIEKLYVVIITSWRQREAKGTAKKKVMVPLMVAGISLPFSLTPALLLRPTAAVAAPPDFKSPSRAYFTLYGRPEPPENEQGAAGLARVAVGGCGLTLAELRLMRSRRRSAAAASVEQSVGGGGGGSEEQQPELLNGKEGGGREEEEGASDAHGRSDLIIRNDPRQMNLS